MLRGVISLSAEQVDYLLNLSGLVDQSLIEKLQSLAHGQASRLLELSEGQLEQLLDILPPPGEDVMTTELRTTLLDYLANFRH